jgi:hypothetical protein
VEEKPGVATLGEIQQMADKANGFVLEASTPKRCSSGREFPRHEMFRAINKVTVKGTLSEQDPDIIRRIFTRYWAAKRLHTLLERVSSLNASKSKFPLDADKWTSLLGCADESEWIQRRYQSCLCHWRSQKLGK